MEKKVLSNFMCFITNYRLLCFKQSMVWLNWFFDGHKSKVVWNYFYINSASTFSYPLPPSKKRDWVNIMEAIADLFCVYQFIISCLKPLITIISLLLEPSRFYRRLHSSRIKVIKTAGKCHRSSNKNLCT